MEKLSREFKRQIHGRMIRFYAVSRLVNEKNFARFLDKFIFPGISSDRPYQSGPQSVKNWEIDCYIKKNIDKVLLGFLRTVKIMGQENFKKQVEEELKLLGDIGNVAMHEGRFGRK